MMYVWQIIIIKQLYLAQTCYIFHIFLIFFVKKNYIFFHLNFINSNLVFMYVFMLCNHVLCDNKHEKSNYNEKPHSKQNRMWFSFYLCGNESTILNTPFSNFTSISPLCLSTVLLILLRPRP